MLLLLIFGSLLLPQGFALKCYECLPSLSGACKDTPKDCPSLAQCSAMRVITYRGSTILSDINMKTCGGAENCVNGSINFGVTKTVLSTKCCASELCNSQPALEPQTNTPNGRNCYYCDGQSCTRSLNCEGNEDNCVSTAVKIGDTSVTVKGCASQVMCAMKDNPQIEAALGSKLSCCQGNYCNSANAAGAGLVILVAPLISLLFFS